jgi:hypothetical protein
VSQTAEVIEETGGDAGTMAALGAAVLDAENFILKLCRG